MIKTWMATVAFAAGSLLRRWGKNVATLVALVIVSSAFASVAALTSAVRSEATASVSGFPDVVVSRLQGGRPHTMPVAQGESIRQIAGVLSVRARVWGYLYLDAIAANVVVVGWPQARISVVEQALGRPMPQAHSERTHWVILGDAVARSFGAHEGDELELGGTIFRVAGQFSTQTSIVSADTLLVSDSDARVLLQMNDTEATDIAVYVPNADELATVAQKISRQQQGARVITRADVARLYELTYNGRGGLLFFALIPTILALLVLAWDRLTGLSPDQRKEIAVLKTVGFSTEELLRIRLIEALILALTAWLFATLCAGLYVDVLGAPGLLNVLLGWSALRPVMGPLHSGFSGNTLVVVALVIAPWMVVALVPAWRSASIEPAEVLQEQ
jgi:ABC-type lipoprotein release transport system permease subunit